MDGVSFADCHERRTDVRLDGGPVPFIGELADQIGPTAALSEATDGLHRLGRIGRLEPDDRADSGRLDSDMLVKIQLKGYPSQCTVGRRSERGLSVPGPRQG